jgi:malonyl-CoA O-methyltransferase
MRGFFDKRSANWDERVGAGSIEHLTAFAAGLTHIVPHPERVLEIGTGTGEGALLLAREFPRASIRGIDLAPEMVAKAQAKIGLDPDGRVAFKVADAADLPWNAGSFDLVAQLNMPPFFAEIARVLRPGGFVVAAASIGPETPFYTTPEALAKGFARHGISERASGTAGPGTFWVGHARA